MEILKASAYPFTILKTGPCAGKIYPLFRDNTGNESMHLASPQHGRSYIVGMSSDNRWIVSKGNGLSYTSHSYIVTAEQNVDVLGLLLLPDAIRDFTLGEEVATYGILTNRMEYVLELAKEIEVRGKSTHPILLQYSVECPYRISDAVFISPDIYMPFVRKWRDKAQSDESLPFHMIAAEVLVKNLRILHNNKILHNAITSQNYTWALELLDFELAYSPAFPYQQEDYNQHVPVLYQREIIQTYQIIMDIAGILRENIDNDKITRIFRKYDFIL